MNNTFKFASFLSEFRKRNRIITTTQVEALLFVASGVDNISDLTSIMLDERGESMPLTTVTRVIHYLSGRGRYCKGRWINQGGEPLIQRREHPHKRGYQLILTDVGKDLIGNYLEE